jgi:hypothetical protein
MSELWYLVVPFRFRFCNRPKLRSHQKKVKGSKQGDQTRQRLPIPERIYISP